METTLPMEVVAMEDATTTGITITSKEVSEVDAVADRMDVMEDVVMEVMEEAMVNMEDVTDLTTLAAEDTRLFDLLVYFWATA
ncbi:Hypothetical protein MVR_LOCUS144 [uncultured virus]|nr:Hypothetical protein MVR_LOCUS144 [uncultured virus]